MRAAASHADRRLVGHDHVLVHQSSFGHLYRLSRLNELNLSQFAHMFQLPFSIRQMIRAGGAVNWEAMDAWAYRQFGATYAAKNATISQWLPYKHAGPEKPAPLRGCPTCLAYGYHTKLHQLPWISRCPLHQDALTETCRCGGPLLPRNSHNGRATLLVCECSRDSFDRRMAIFASREWPADTLLSIMDPYRQEAARSRAVQTMFNPHSDLLDTEAYEQLIGVGTREKNEVNRWIRSVSPGSDGIIDDALVEAASAAWSAPGMQAKPKPISNERYEWLCRKVVEIRETAHEFGISQPLISIGDLGIAVQRTLVVTRPTIHRAFGLVQAHVCNSGWDQYGLNVLEVYEGGLWGQAPGGLAASSRQCIAAHLSEIAAFAALSCIQRLVERICFPAMPARHPLVDIVMLHSRGTNGCSKIGYRPYFFAEHPLTPTAWKKHT